jgi:hypothetical protein
VLSQELGANHTSKVQDRLFDRVLEAMPSDNNFRPSKLDSVMLGKPGHLALSAQNSHGLALPLTTRLRSIPASNPVLLRAQSRSAAGSSQLPWTELLRTFLQSHQQKFRLQATTIKDVLKQEFQGAREELKEELRNELCPLERTVRYKVALTGQQGGKNDQLRALLEELNCNIECVELPCMAVVPGEDVAKPSLWTDDQKEAARSIDVVTFLSPDAVRVWAERMGSNFMAVAIGVATAKEAEAQSFTRVVAPQSVEVEALVDVIRTAVGEVDESQEAETDISFKDDPLISVYLGLHG